jgi:hypothetical protein
MRKKLALLEERYRRKLENLGGIGYISQGSVYARAKGKPGSRYQWSWKNARQKTESLALSEEQYVWLKQAVENHRKTQAIIRDLCKISKEIALKTMPGTVKRK